MAEKAFFLMHCFTAILANSAMQVDMIYYKGKPVKCLAILHNIRFFLSDVQSFALTITKR
ncbi:hypothetical protein [Aneurinibacillus migulanus]|uniref:hypothetical protein n=1 Tax=Aneurinibacillus migulanus TaxID=47500 RepID=UPI00116974F7|nr:hypothetical protein [Aneurinibacillus migulanus]GED15057.1 hypothetical protein AMI01nite_30480 [Aneurinibacillus migulanus]